MDPGLRVVPPAVPPAPSILPEAVRPLPGTHQLVGHRRLGEEHVL